MSATLTALIHGEAGVGKSRLIDTAPAPRLILDAEGRAQYLPSQPKVLWDPRTQAPPVNDGTWETCVAIVPDFQTMELVFGWLQSGQHGFLSVCIDSLMECQKRLIDNVAGMEQLDQRDWGIVLRRLEKLVREYRDLVISPVNPTQVVVMTVGSKLGNSDGKMRPMLQGAMATTVPYFMDIVGYMYTDFVPEIGVSRAMLVQPTQTAVAKDGTGRLLEPTIKNPDLGAIYQLLGGQPAAAAPAAPVASATPPQTQQGGAPA